MVGAELNGVGDDGGSETSPKTAKVGRIFHPGHADWWPRGRLSDEALARLCDDTTPRHRAESTRQLGATGLNGDWALILLTTLHLGMRSEPTRHAASVAVGQSTVDTASVDESWG